VNPIRVLLADERVLFSEALACLLASQEDIQVVGRAATIQEATEKTTAQRPDIVLLNIGMAAAGGGEAAKSLQDACPSAKVVALSISDSEVAVFEALKEAAVAYLVKVICSEALFQKVRDIARGEIALPSFGDYRLLGEPGGLERAEETAYNGLSKRNAQVLEMVAQGKSNKEIGLALGIAESTVKRHLHNILRRLHLKNRTEAAAYVLRSSTTIRRQQLNGPRRVKTTA